MSALVQTLSSRAPPSCSTNHEMLPPPVQSLCYIMLHITPSHSLSFIPGRRKWSRKTTTKGVANLFTLSEKTNNPILRIEGWQKMSLLSTANVYQCFLLILCVLCSEFLKTCWFLVQCQYQISRWFCNDLSIWTLKPVSSVLPAITERMSASRARRCSSPMLIRCNTPGPWRSSLRHSRWWASSCLASFATVIRHGCIVLVTDRTVQQSCANLAIILE